LKIESDFSPNCVALPENGYELPLNLFASPGNPQCPACPGCATCPTCAKTNHSLTWVFGGIALALLICLIIIWANQPEKI
jgi:hypothetical protein